ncbi:hypothetical protein IYQ_24093, partial [Aeromonas salmonicida subsp. salmonicida 01-B526]
TGCDTGFAITGTLESDKLGSFICHQSIFTVQGRAFILVMALQLHHGSPCRFTIIIPHRKGSVRGRVFFAWCNVFSHMLLLIELMGL